ncbi:MAG TPA: NAD-dependent epimerase/dehydratase family protein [Candidatus Nanopelagicales bacterium]|jgi:nucleoside-diphosphate-sugar epimerase
MRIVVAGATGVIGIRLVPLLIADGHEILGLTRTPTKVELLESLGAHAAVCDVFDAPALTDVVVSYAPQAVIHQVTDLADDPALIDYAANSRTRTEGTTNLLAAATAAGATRFLAQSVAWQLEGAGGEAVAAHERAVLGHGGVVVRYGQLYGPGTYFESTAPPPPRIHVDDAARRTVPLLDLPSGVVELVE